MEAGTMDSKELGPGILPAVVTCVKCQRVNRGNAEFCAQCGESLWEECIECNGRCAAGERFCNGCGVNIAEAFQSRLDRYYKALAAADQSAADADFAGAVRALQRVHGPAHSRFKDLAERVKQRISEIRQQEARSKDVLEAGLARIENLMEEKEYDAACKLLRQLPPGLRNAQAESLLQAAEQALAEIKRLKQRIQQAAEKQEWKTLKPSIDRLLELRPSSDSARRLAEQVRDKLLRLAKRELDAFQYARAAATLECVPVAAVETTVEAWRQKVGELAWIADDLKQSPVVDPPLAGIAKRAQEAMPQDEQVQALVRNVLRKSQQPVAEGRSPWPSWIRAPQHTYIGMPVDFIGPPARLRLSDAARTQFSQHPGAFPVACGMALQMLGLAPIQTNLLRSERTGLFAKLSFGKKEAVKTAWGIDLGEHAVKAVKLSVESSGQVTVETCCYLPHRLPLCAPEAATQRHQLLQETLTALKSQAALAKTDALGYALPGYQILGRVLSLPNVDDKKLAEMVNYEVREQVPIATAELNWDFQALRLASANDLTATCRVVLIAIRQRDAAEQLRIMQELGLPMHVLQTGCLALHNYAVFERLHGDGSRAIALLDVGATGTNFVVSSPADVWFRSSRLGAEAFTDAAVRAARATRQQADELKRAPQRARSLRRLYDELDVAIQRMADELQRSLAACGKERPELPAAELFGAGGGFLQHGLLRFLRNGK